MYGLLYSFFLPLVTLSLVGCLSDFQSADNTVTTTEASSTSEIAPLVANQAPTLACTLTNMKSGQVRALNSLSGAETFFADAPREGDTLQLNCSESTDAESESTSLSFSADFNFDPEAPDFQKISDELTIDTGSVLGVGRHHIAIKVTDPEGNETIKTFRQSIRCANPMAPKMEASAVSVSPEGMLNYFSFSVDPSKVSNVNNDDFSVSWDFNGDGDMDPIDPKSNTVWGNSGTYDFPGIYNVLGGIGKSTREIGVRIRNVCQEEATFAIPVTFNMDNIPRTPSSFATVKPFHYLQADIVGENKDNIIPFQRTNTDYLATWYPSDKFKRIACDYKVSSGGIATFMIAGFHKYRKLDQSKHGMSIKIENIKDNKEGGEIVRTSESDGITVASANYKVSSISDALSNQDFSKQGACKARIVVVHNPGLAPCPSGPAAETDAIIITGEFDCPTLNSNTETLAAENGKFFCEVAVANQCVGVGAPCEAFGTCQDGGGVPPPEQ